MHRKKPRKIRNDPLAADRTFSPNRTLEETAGVKGENRKRAVDAARTGGGERSETVPKPPPRR